MMKQEGRGLQAGEKVDIYSPLIYSILMLKIKGNLIERRFFKIAGRNINYLPYAVVATLKVKNAEHLQALVIEFKQQSKKMGLKLSIKKSKLMERVQYSTVTNLKINNKDVEVEISI